MPYVYLYTGEGAGKTTNALGLAMRMLGHGKKTLMVQFLKWNRNTGEYQFQKFTNGLFEVIQYGRDGWKGFDNIEISDKINSLRALNDVKNKLNKANYDLIILDEVNLAVFLGLVTDDEVINLIDSMPDTTNVVLTGRHASNRLIEKSDFVNEIIVIKQPDKSVCEEGIQY